MNIIEYEATWKKVESKWFVACENGKIGDVVYVHSKNGCTQVVLMAELSPGLFDFSSCEYCTRSTFSLDYC